LNSLLNILFKSCICCFRIHRNKIT